MSHKLFRLVHDLIDNKPLLIQESSLRSIVDYLETRDSSLSAKDIEAGLVTDTSERMQKIYTDDLAIIPIEGSLTYQASFLNALCGITSYQNLLSDVEEAIDLGVKTIVFSVDSPGGSAYAMLSSAESIRDRMDKAGVRSIAYVDGTSASAAYGLSVIADEIIAHPDSSIGSVGVVIRLTDASEKMKKDGVKPVYITSAKSKVPLDPEGRFKEDFISELQDSVDNLHVRFSEHVAKYRNLSVDAVNATEAKVYDANKALSIGFIDKVMTHDQLSEYLVDINEKRMETISPMNLSIFKPKAKAPNVDAVASIEEDEAMQLAELQAQFNELNAKLEASVGQLATMESLASEAKALAETKDAELQAALSELSQIKQAQEQAAADAKLAKLAAVYGDDEAKELFEAMSALPEAAFEKIVSAKRLDNELVSKSEMFVETGVTADAEAPKVLTQEELLEQKIAASNSKKQ